MGDIKLDVLRFADLKYVAEIAASSGYSYPHLGRNLVDNAIVRDGPKILGFGAIKHFYEMIVILDGTHREKTQSLKLLFNAAVQTSRNNGIEELHALSPSSEYARLLEKHFNFKARPEIPLILEVK